MTYHDHHFHPFGYSATFNGLEVYETRDIGELQRQLADRARRIEGPILAERLNDEGLAEMRKEFGQRADAGKTGQGKPTRKKTRR